MWMNEGDVEEAVFLLNTRLPEDYGIEVPNLARGARILERLMCWTNRNSDGWPYWAKPGNAAKGLQEVLSSQRRAFVGGKVLDLTDAELRALLSPIKSFLTKQGVEHSLILDEPPPPAPPPPSLLDRLEAILSEGELEGRKAHHIVASISALVADERDGANV